MRRLSLEENARPLTMVVDEVEVGKDMLPVILWLLKHGADLNAERTYENVLLGFFQSPLLKALIANDRKGALEALEQFKNEPELLSLERSSFPTALAIASGEKRGQEAIVRFMLDNFRRYLGQPARAQALYAATINNRVDLVKLLYRSLTTESAELVNQSFIVVAARRRYHEIFNFLLSAPYSMLTPLTLQTAFVRCCYADNVEGVQTLFTEALSSDPFGRPVVSPAWLPTINQGLRLAALRGNREVVEFILDRDNELLLDIDLRSVARRLEHILHNRHMGEERKWRYASILDLLLLYGRSRAIRQLVLLPRRQSPQSTQEGLAAGISRLPSEVIDLIARRLPWRPYINQPFPVFD